MNKKRYSGNPFVKSLGKALTKDEFFQQINQIPKLNKTGSLADKIAALNDIRYEYFQAMSRHFYLYQTFVNVLFEGYKVRTPESLVDRLKTIKKNNETNKEGFARIGRKSIMGFCLIGAMGMGKTSTIDKILSMFPQKVYHQDLGVTQVTYLKIACTLKGSTKQLCKSFFSELDRVLDERFTDKFRRYGEEDLIIEMENKGALSFLGCLIIDEVHDLKNVSQYNRTSVLNFFKLISNQVGVPIILIGTDEANEILFSNLQIASRALGVGSFKWDRIDDKLRDKNGKKTKDENPEWNMLIASIWDLQVFENPGKLTTELKDLYYKESQGIIRALIALHTTAQELALNNKAKCLTATFIRNAAQTKLFGQERMMLGIETNDPDILKDYDDINVMENKIYESLEEKIDQRTKDKSWIMMKTFVQQFYPNLEEFEIDKCIEVVKKEFINSPAQVQLEKLRDAVSSIVDKSSKKKKGQKGKLKGDLIELCQNSTDTDQNYMMLKEAGIIIPVEDLIKFRKTG
jgi:hypothetical protein